MWNESDWRSMRENILILAHISGDADIVDQLSQDGILYGILECYCTGTQRTKEWNCPVGLPLEGEIGPITTHLNEDSPTSQAKENLLGTRKQLWSTLLIK